jgi:hypothetical protein
LEQGERDHDFALQGRFTLDKASRQALMPMRQVSRTREEYGEIDLGRDGQELKNRRL